jgi:hypothetical protein
MAKTTAMTCKNGLSSKLPKEDSRAPDKNAILVDPFSTFTEWASEADDRAYAKL